MNIYQTEEIQSNIERYWKNIKEIADNKDESRITELRLNVTLLVQYLARKHDLMENANS